jgi:hypothetical protein
MYASIRSYAGDSALADTLAARSDEVKALMEKATGFRSYHLIRTPDTTLSFTVCDAEKGVDEANKLAAEWLHEQLPKVQPPTVYAGDVVFETTRQLTAV